MNSTPVHIPSSLTGNTAQFIDPASVRVLISVHGAIIVTLQGNRKVEWKPAPSALRTAKADALRLLFDEPTIAKAVELEKLTGKLINPHAIEAVNFLGGLLHFDVKGGELLSSAKPSTFSDYRAVVALIYGDEAAQNLKPLSPPVPKAVDKNVRDGVIVPKRPAPVSFEQHYTDMREAALASVGKAAPVSAALDKVPTQPDARLHAIGVIADRLNYLAHGLGGAEIIQLSEDGPTVTLKRFVDAVTAIDKASVDLYRLNDAASLEAFKDAVSAATGALSRLPQSPQVSHIARMVTAELGRLSDVQLIGEATAKTEA